MLASSSAAAACVAATTTGGCCDAPFLWLRFATVVVAVAVAAIVAVGVVVGVVAVAAADVLREFLDRGGAAASGNEPSAGVDGLLARPLLVVTTVVAIGVCTFATSPF